MQSVSPPDRPSSKWRLPVESNGEIWERTKYLGRGGFGDVWLEQCKSDPEGSPARVRAVKRINKGIFDQTSRELDTLAVLSDPLSPHFSEASFVLRVLRLATGTKKSASSANVTL